MDNDEDITAITTTTASENDESSELERDPTQRNEFPTSSVTGCVSGSSAGAKYRLMSPAKLPISRSACLTIPPGLSPTSFIESPVLLSDMKVEPSPTTGSFIKPQMMHLFSTTSFSNANKFDERKSRSFEFRPQDGSYSGSVIPSVRPKIPADMNHQQSECSFQGEGQCQTQSFSLLPSLKNEVPVSNELSLSAPVHMFPPKDSLAADTKCDELDQRGQHNARFQASQSDHKGIGSSVAVERVSDDGYNWRKYGQKHVKGSEHPRSYYKCTHPNCEVKKLFERSHDGQITEIVYKGEHDHPKPQPSRRLTSGAILSVQEERTEKVLSVTSQDDKSSNIYGQMAHNMEQNGGLDNVEAASQDEIDDDDPLSKRRKMDVEMLDVTPVVKPIREPRVVVQTLSEVDILDDGYRWRKYGQKVVRGNPNPRSYYKCTNAGCPVRKHVERASHDPKAVITTYEGKHNHDVPTAKTNSHETAGLMPLNAMSRIRSDERDTISLDLGVGISSAPESRSNEQQQTLQSELVESQIHTGNSINMLQAAPVSSYYRVLNGGINQYGSRQNLNEGHFESPPLTHSSNPYPQNMGRILMGP